MMTIKINILSNMLQVAIMPFKSISKYYSINLE